MVSHQSRKRVCLDVPYEGEIRSGLSTLQKGRFTMFNKLPRN